MNEIRIRVYKLNRKGENETVYRNTVTMPTGVEFPFGNMVRSLALLYPRCMIEFTTNFI